MDRGWLKGFTVLEENNWKVKISHIFYADNTLPLYGAEKQQIMYLRAMLLIFEAVFGLLICLRAPCLW